MQHSGISQRARRSGLILTLVVLSIVIVALALSGCGSGSGSGSGYGMKPSGGAPVTAASGKSGMSAMSATDTSTTDPSVQTCAVCSRKAKPKSVAGSAVVKDGVQVVSIAIVDGFYVPNKITLKAAMPVQVVFTGKAKGCIANPTFKSLNKTGDLSKTGTVTLDLGSLKAGIYAFGCAMGMGDGMLTVQ